MSNALTWIGHFQGSASFPIINRNLTDALERRGLTVLRNRHNFNGGLTRLVIANQFPPQAINVRHAVNVCASIWEFTGPHAVPESFKKVFAGFDAVLVGNQFVYDQYCQATATPVHVIRYLGVDPVEFSPQGSRVNWGALFPGEDWPDNARQIILMVGGTDLRHGWDVALAVLRRLPDDVHLVAKWDVHYPEIHFGDTHERLHILHKDLGTLAPLYRSADMFLMTARGVGFSFPVIEALACGLPVASTPLPPIRDYAPVGRVVFGEGGQYVPLGIHHAHDDCLPWWWEPDADGMYEATAQALALPKQAPDADWLARWSWDGVAEDFERGIEGWL